MSLKSIAICCLLISGCAITRAETNYELNRRSGEPIPSENLEGSLTLRSNSNLPRRPYMPARLPPVVERVWFFDRQVGGYWQQGTWVWLEVEQSRWLNEVDPGGAPLVLNAQPKAEHETKSQKVSQRKAESPRK